MAQTTDKPTSSSIPAGPIVLDGKQLAALVRRDLKVQIEARRRATSGLRAPALGVVLVGDNKASRTYVNAKIKAAAEVGITVTLKELPQAATEEVVRSTVESLNKDPHIDGILLQLPVPSQIKADKILAIISPLKDVDGLNPINLGSLVSSGSEKFTESFVPCTPRGVMALIDLAFSSGGRPPLYSEVPRPILLEGQQALVIGRSRLVGKPAALLLLERDATVSIAHSRTRDLEQMVRAADIVVAAAGKSGLVRAAWLKPGSIVIDVGINQASGKLVGDVEPLGADSKVFAYSPVPGGVGPMTVAMLLSNTVQSWAKKGKSA